MSWVDGPVSARELLGGFDHCRVRTWRWELAVSLYHRPGEIDAPEWYDEAGRLEFRSEVPVNDIERDLAVVQATGPNGKPTCTVLY